jgi:uncharacterized protein (TIGR01244 family)
MNHFKCFSTTITLLTIFVASCTQPETMPDAGTDAGTNSMAEAESGMMSGGMMSESVMIDGMRNNVRVDNVTVGAQPSPKGMEEAAAQGYTVIVSNRGPGEIDWDEKALADSLGLRFVSMPMTGPNMEITDAQVNELDEIITEPGANVLLHCASGNRASGLWATWLIEKKGVSSEDAFELAAAGGMGSIRAVVDKRLADR